MAALTIKIPSSAQLQFPRCCVGCDDPSPDQHIWLRERGDRFYDLFIPGSIFFRKRHDIGVPVCRNCRIGHRGLRFARGAMTAILGIVAIYFGLRVAANTGEESWLSNKIIVLAAVVIAMVPIGAWEYVWPPVVSLEPEDNELHFAFRNHAYGEAFLKVNDGAAVVGDNSARRQSDGSSDE